ncbi:MAG: hypothetical protein IPK19_22380 [Chloroflexi bacterium]|nr:hypothetical protein [Chloroflexota bacterium]
MTDPGRSQSAPTPVFKRARFRPQRPRDQPLSGWFDGDAFKSDWDEPLILVDWDNRDEDASWDADWEDEPLEEDDGDETNGPFWTSNRIVMAIIALILIVTLLAYSFEGIIAPTPPPPTEIFEPGPLI